MGERLQSIIGPYENNCNAAENPNGERGYITTPLLKTGVVRKKYTHHESSGLDHIVSFDSAETVQGAYIGQINMVTVSSFCGPEGNIWGYDLVRPGDGFFSPRYGPDHVQDSGRNVTIFSADPLFAAAEALYGTREHKKFPIRPGAFVYCAEQQIKMEGPIDLFCAIGIGIVSNHDTNAHLFMEEAWAMPILTRPEEEHDIAVESIENIAGSIISVGHNNMVEYESIFVSVQHVRVHDGEIGCALVAIPYITLAKRAAVGDDGDILPLDSMTIEEWRAIT